MLSDERLVTALAERLYVAHKEFNALLSEANGAWVRWWAAAEDVQQPYIAAAITLLFPDKEDRDG